MQEYISIIIYICIFCIILELILPENKLKKYINVLASLIIILNLITPVINVLNSKNVIQVISSSIENIQSNIKTKEYDFNNVGNKLILSSVREELEQDISLKCKEEFENRCEIERVKIVLNKNYSLDRIDVYVNKLSEIVVAGEIIDYISIKYEITPSIINVVKEE